MAGRGPDHRHALVRRSFDAVQHRDHPNITPRCVANKAVLGLMVVVGQSESNAASPFQNAD